MISKETKVMMLEARFVSNIVGVIEEIAAPGNGDTATILETLDVQQRDLVRELINEDSGCGETDSLSGDRPCR